MYYEAYTCYYISAIEITHKNDGKLSSGGRGWKFKKHKPFWTPKAPFRVTIALRRFESRRGAKRRQTHAVRPEGPSGEAASPSSHPDPSFHFHFNLLAGLLLKPCLLRERLCGSSAAIV